MIQNHLFKKSIIFIWLQLKPSLNTIKTLLNTINPPFFHRWITLYGFLGLCRCYRPASPRVPAQILASAQRFWQRWNLGRSMDQVLITYLTSLNITELISMSFQIEFWLDKNWCASIDAGSISFLDRNSEVKILIDNHSLVRFECVSNMRTVHKQYWSILKQCIWHEFEMTSKCFFYNT